MFSKKVKLTAYTPDKNIYDFAKPVYKTKEKPGWLASLKTVITQWDSNIRMPIKSGTAVTCPGIRDFISTPIQLNMWGDIDIIVNPDGSWQHNARPEWGMSITQHHEDQWKGAYNNRIALKLGSPWVFECNSAVKFLMTESHYSTNAFRDLGVLFPPGVTNYKTQHSTNVHLNCPLKSEPYMISLKHGMPLISIFPMTEKEVDFSVELSTIDKYNDLSGNFPYTFVGRYYKKGQYE